MSRAFVKESDDDNPELPELPLSPHPNYVTARGLQQLQDRLRAIDLALATPNPNALDNRLEQAERERQQRWLQTRIGSAIPVRCHHNGAQVEFGCAVELADEADRRYRYRIVGEDEAEPDHGRISWVSPLARALNGAKIGDSVRWQRPAGDLLVEVLAIDSSAEPS